MRDDTLHYLRRKAPNHLQPKLIVFCVGIVLSAFIAGCSKANKPIAEAPAIVPTLAADQPQEVAKLPPPQAPEVDEAVKRVFKESALVDSNQTPAFVTGDFNGDSSPDLAVALKPDAAKIADLNQEFPAWILRDLTPSANDSKSPRLAVAADEPLLAVIHGFGPNGWRDPQATQTFLLKNAAGSRMTAQSADAFRSANQGRKMPGLRGDVVSEELGGRPGYIYYSNSSYSWYDPKTFTGEPVPRRTHGDRAAMK